MGRELAWFPGTPVRRALDCDHSRLGLMPPPRHPAVRGDVDDDHDDAVDDRSGDPPPAASSKVGSSSARRYPEVAGTDATVKEPR